MKATPYKPPILTAIFNVIAACFFAASGLALIGTLVTAARARTEMGVTLFTGVVGCVALLVMGLIYIGLGQAIGFLGRTAYNTTLLVEAKVTIEKAEIMPVAKVAPVSQQASTPAPVRRAASIFYYAVDGGQEGPFDVQELRGLVLAGTISRETLLFREGDTTWRPAASFPEFRS